MADFYQTGVVATLHRLKSDNLDILEHELVTHARENPIALVLPSLVDELDRPALSHIVDELSAAPYLDQIVVSLDRASEPDFHRALTFFRRLPRTVRVIWNDGPRLQALYGRLRDAGLLTGSRGKGLACWIAYGFVLAGGRCRVIAVHDCDITTYSRELLVRLCYPVVNSSLDFEFVKGFYARFSDRLNGRVTRLFMTPLIRSMQTLVGRHPFLVYLDSFRYALAGEFAMRADLARINRIPSDWGLEVGVLGEIYRNCALSRVCQSELCHNYDHKHQIVSADDPERGLVRMCVDITQNLLRTLAAEGIVFTDGLFKTLLVRFIRTAQDTITRYHADAAINSLPFDRHEEEVMVAAFTEAIRIACERFQADPLGAPLIPNWNRIAAAFPTFLDELHQAVIEDSATPAQV
jgi:glucosyl-3-phosphoglycerate synthase